jgi:DNA-binding transcriptional regulator GbsR (MarR family)
MDNFGGDPLDRLAQRKREFAALFGEHMALEHEASAMAGRVMGSLLVSHPGERTIDELTSDLGVSRGAISMATRDLLRLGMIEKTGKPRDRRHYYHLRPDLWARLYLERTDNLRDHIAMAERGLEILSGEPLEAKRPLMEMAVFFRFMMEEMPEIVARWRRRSPQMLAELEDRLGGPA